jgi:hypothetical protein
VCPVVSGTKETRACNIQNCPVNCIGEWGNYGACDKSCGGGLQYRQYKVTQNEAYGGTTCPFSNSFIQSQACNNQACPVNCQGYWTEWSECSGCTGTQSRTYIVTQNAQNGGISCEATAGKIETRTCVKDCNCILGNWGAWSSCYNCNPICPSGTYYYNDPYSGAACYYYNCPAGKICIGRPFAGYPISNNGIKTRTRSIIQNKTGNGLACGVTSETQTCYC